MGPTFLLSKFAIYCVLTQQAVEIYDIKTIMKCVATVSCSGHPKSHILNNNWGGFYAPTCDHSCISYKFRLY